MNILITVHTYLPHFDGVQFVTQYLAEGLVKRGHQVTLLTYLRPQSPVKETIGGVNILRWTVHTRYTIHRGEKKKYQNFILQTIGNYDVLINVGTQTALTDWLFPIFDKIKIPKVLYLHSIFDFKWHRQDFYSLKTCVSKFWNILRWKFYYMRYENVFQQYNLVTQLHPMDYSYIFFKNKYGIMSKIIENAADQNFFEPLSSITSSLPTRYVLNVANFIERKNQKKCVELFYESDLPADWTLILIGSQPTEYLDTLKTYNLKNDEKKVLFLTNVSRESIYIYVKQAALYLMCSTWEAFPISLIEAMAAGVPFISSDVGIVRFLSGGITVRNKQEFLYWLNRLGTDQGLREQYGSLGKHEAFAHYQVEDKVQLLEKYIQQISLSRGI